MIDIELQVIGSSLRAIAEEMGAALVRSAFSANIKERRDCSTALFDEQGRMVTQAEHIPVHLGAMPDAVAAVRARDPAPGEPWILNDPYTGGTHLPDLTIVTRTSLGYAVTRAHHADVGGSEPGSLPPGSRTLAEEGVVLPPTRLDDETLASLVARMRNPDERRGDLRAQLAAHRLAERRVEELCERRGRERVVAAMEELLAYSERVVRAAIRRLPDGRYEGADALETPGGRLDIRATVTIAGDGIEIDFEGTAPQHEGNLNCPLAVTRSACLYVVRCLTAPDLPASGGAFAPVTVRAPEECLVNARPPAAVHLLRDDRRRPGRVPGRGRAVGRPRRDVEHLQHARGGPRARVSAAGRALCLAARIRRRRGATRRRRRRPRTAHPRAVPSVAAHAAPHARTARRARRRGRPPRPQLPERRRAPGLREPRSRPGRPPPHRDARRGRVGRYSR
jgi:N-methylhydantoinase B/oxoprolinase/acetone carboxylase alpha subunit